MARVCWLLSLVCVACVMGFGMGCQSSLAHRDPGMPRVLMSPYPGQPVTIAVAPPINETGFSRLDVLGVADTMVNQVQEVPGLMGLPVNRVLRAMESLEMGEVRTPSDARTLARAVGADAIVVMTITSWEPYEPLQIGYNAALFAVSDRALASSPNVLDPRAINAAWSDERMTYRGEVDGPDAVASLHLNSADRDVQSLASRYAAGRHDPNTALGLSRYVKAMGYYTQFASYHTLELLLNAERQRVGDRMTFAGVETR